MRSITLLLHCSVLLFLVVHWGGSLPSAEAGILRGNQLGEAIRERAKSNRRAMVKNQVERILRLNNRRNRPSPRPFLASGLVMEGLSSGELGLGALPAHFEDYTEKLQSSFPLCSEESVNASGKDDWRLDFKVVPSGQRVLRGRLNLFVDAKPREELRLDVYWIRNNELTLLDTKSLSGSISGSWVSLNVLPAVSSWYEDPSSNQSLSISLYDRNGKNLPLRDVIVPMNCSDTSSLPLPNVLRVTGRSVPSYPLLDILTVEPPPMSSVPHQASIPNPLMKFPIFGRQEPRRGGRPRPTSTSENLLLKMEDISFASSDPNLSSGSSSRGNVHQSRLAFRPVAGKVIRSRAELLEALNGLGPSGGSPDIQAAILKRLQHSF